MSVLSVESTTGVEARESPRQADFEYLDRVNYFLEYTAAE